MSKKINEEVSPNGLKFTQAAQKETKKESDAYYKSVQKKIDSVYGTKGKVEVEPIKREYTDEEKEYHDEMETLNGLEMTEYASEPDDTFKDRAKKGITGDSTMGNETHTGEWNPETGEGNGNTEPVWNASSEDFADKLLKRIEKSKKKRDDQALNYVALGDDMELKSKPNLNKSLAFENVNKSMDNDKNYIDKFLEEQELEETTNTENIEENTTEDIMESVNTHFAVVGNKIVEGFNFNGLNKEAIVSEASKLVFTPVKNILGESVNTKEIKIYTSRGLAKIGLNESETNDWVQLKEEETTSQPYDASYTHFLIHKDSNTIVEAFEFSNIDKDEMKQWLNDFMSNTDYDLKPKDVKLVSKKNAEQQGIQLDQSNSYYSKVAKPMNESKIKRLKFNNQFNGFKKAETLIPESYKVDGRKFEMTDGNETYLIRWEGNLNEGVAVVLEQNNKTQFTESMNKMKHLMAFNGFDADAVTKGKDRLQENDFFQLNLIKAKKQLVENQEIEKSVLTENVINKKDKFKVLKLEMDALDSKNASLTKAKYICEGNSYEGVEYHITIKESELPIDILAERISINNKNNKPEDRSISFRYFNESGEELTNLYKKY